MKGKIPEIASSHITSRVLQSCVKHCSEDERTLVFLELRPQFIGLATNTYSVHLVAKMFDQASKDQLGELISSLHGHVASLLRHAVGSLVVEQAFNLGNSSQKQALLSELFSPKLQLFKDIVSTKDTKDALLAKNDNSSSQSSILLTAGYRVRWILVVIDLSSLMVYYLDSVDVKVNPSLQIVINTALKIYETTKGNRRRNSTWRVLKCPKQPLTVVSGFYVMRYMKDLLSDQDVLTNEDFNGKKTYTDAEIDEVRAEWISFVLSMV